MRYSAQPHRSSVVSKPRSGLPPHLQAGIETLSGISMDGVGVHYNSPQPAKIDAAAYARGRDIHLGPGQEHHLPHEAWHVVQQAQGRVRPTRLLGGVAINEDARLEREADVMGERALWLRPTGKLGLTPGASVKPGFVAGSQGNSKVPSDYGGQSRVPIRTTQRALLNKEKSESLATPVGAIAKALRLNGTNIHLPGTQPVNDLDRAEVVSAEIKKSTLRDSERSSSGNLTKITSMARAEQVLLQGGGEIKKFYDAGHLVADQLVGGKSDSFQTWNLAPQISEFNAPVYAQVVEEEVKKVASQGKTVKLRVQLEYPDGGSYPVRVSDLVDQGVVVPSSKENTKYVFKKKPTAEKSHSVDESLEIKIPRRIPSRWGVSAEVQGGQFGAKKLGTGRRDLGFNFQDKITEDTQPLVGRPFKFMMPGAKAENGTIKIPAHKYKTMEAVQWYPKSQIDEADVKSLVAEVFPDWDWPQIQSDGHRRAFADVVGLLRRIEALELNPDTRGELRRKTIGLMFMVSQDDEGTLDVAKELEKLSDEIDREEVEGREKSRESQSEPYDHEARDLYLKMMESIAKVLQGIEDQLTSIKNTLPENKDALDSALQYAIRLKAALISVGDHF